MSNQENEKPQWMQYWDDVAARLIQHLQANTNPLVIRYLVNSIALYSWVTEDWDKKTIKNGDLRGKLSIFMVETQDLMRGILACYEHMTMAPLGLLLRTAFELHVSLKFIVRSTEPEKWADLFDRFQEIEHVLGVKASHQFPNPSEADWKRTAHVCPEWFEPGTIKLKDRRPHWTATNTDLRQLAKASHVNLEREYVDLYKANSKFTHASPLIRNMYRKDRGLQSVPSKEQCGTFAMLGMVQCMKVLSETCEFFGVEFPEFDYAVICQDMVEAMGGKRLDPKDFEKK